MCRLYGFRSNTLRKVECELIHSQNSLLVQSCSDERGTSNPHGWGLGIYEDDVPFVVRQPEAACDSESFRLESARVYTCNVLAHVRQATVGDVRLENTHPFVQDHWLFAHNGNLAAFELIRSRLLHGMEPKYRNAIQGNTDSEHLFYWLLSLRERENIQPLLNVVRKGVHQVIKWSNDEGPSTEVALNFILTNGEESVGLRYGRTLWYMKRNLVHPCEVCDGAIHVDGSAKSQYNAVVIASERITTTEEWTQIPEGTLFRIDSETRLHFESL